jgi:hypothetical protein
VQWNGIAARGARIAVGSRSQVSREDAVTEGLRRSRGYAAGFSWLVLLLGGEAAGVSRRIAVSAAAAAGSSIRSGNPCSTRERRASSAPLAGWLPVPRRSGQFAVWLCHVVCLSHRSSRGPCTRVYVQTRARGGTGRPVGRSLTVTAPGAPGAPTSPADLDGAALRRAPAGAGTASCASIRLCASVRLSVTLLRGQRRAPARARHALFPAHPLMPVNWLLEVRCPMMARVAGSRNRSRAAMRHPTPACDRQSARRFR